MSGPILISGTVRGPRGPVEDARVFFVAGPEPLPDIAALTDGNGSFSMTVRKAGSYKIQVNAEGFSTKTVSVEVSQQRNAHLDIQLVPER